jgi:hypothetical protein
MRLSINLRGDLAKLSDAELVARLDAAWQAYEAATEPGVDSWSWRGPVRHPRAYRFLSVLSSVVVTTGNGWIDLLCMVAISSTLSSKRAERFLRKAAPSVDMHLTLCEIRDLQDEMERRIARRRAARRPGDPT